MVSIKLCAPFLLLIACQPPIPPSDPGFVVMQQTAVVTTDQPNLAPAPLPADVRGDLGSILVVTDKRVPRPTQVIGVLDFHSNAANEDKGFDELRARAAAMGAEAVIGAEFEHGGGSEPSHLSGIAVRFIDH